MMNALPPPPPPAQHLQQAAPGWISFPPVSYFSVGNVLRIDLKTGVITPLADLSTDEASRQAVAKMMEAYPAMAAAWATAHGWTPPTSPQKQP